MSTIKENTKFACLCNLQKLGAPWAYIAFSWISQKNTNTDTDWLKLIVVQYQPSRCVLRKRCSENMQ